MKTRKTGMGSHQSATMTTDEWLTDPKILSVLGKFDLDPCSPFVRPWDTANIHYTKEDDGLKKEWHGRVWMNPPYSKEITHWHKKMTAQTEDFQEYVFGHAESILFIKGRLYFYHVTGLRARYNGGAPSALVAYGSHNSDILERSGIPGKFLKLK